MIRRTLMILAGAVLLTAPISAQDVRLVFAGKPRLLDCRDQPCFRLDVIAVNDQGQAVDLPQGGVEVLVGDRALPNVYVERRRANQPGGTTGARVRVEPRIQLVLFDTSGSMMKLLAGNDSRFTAARRQLERLLDGFRDGIDQMAIASFDSQQVVARIRGAKFVTSGAEVRKQIEGLRPNPRGNTGLYSAVRESLLVLEPYTKTDAQVSLIVFTDGANDVDDPRVDDKGLLAGGEGLSVATSEARRVGVNVYAIGFGTPGVMFDEAAMRALSYPNERNYFQAGDEKRLIEVFSIVSRRAATGARLLAGPLSDSRAALRGQSLQFTVRTGTLEATSTWEGNPLMAPPVEGTLTAAESKAVTAWFAKDGPPPPMFPPLVMRVVVLIGYSALIALLWFGMPRLIWPDRYVPKPALPPSKPGARPGGRAPAGAAGPRGARPEVTIPPKPAARPGSAAPPPPGRMRDTPGATPSRGREAAPPPRPAEGLGPRQATDATVFVPPAKKPGRES